MGSEARKVNKPVDGWDDVVWGEKDVVRPQPGEILIVGRETVEAFSLG